jgi:hypothetical protein
LAVNVTELHELDLTDVRQLLSRYGLELIQLGDDAPIPASFWGEPEAGLAGRCLFVRGDTPAHSLLHELSHYVCMTSRRRAALWRDAGGDVDEESAVCYLQVLLADTVPGLGRNVIFQDLDTWGYSFREGCARSWFRGDGHAARRWLETNGLIDAVDEPTWELRP